VSNNVCRLEADEEGNIGALDKLMSCRKQWHRLERKEISE